MAAILGLEDRVVEEICAGITGEIVVAANYNCPGQLVISGSTKGIEIACELLKAAGAKRALPLPVGGAFHSPLMEPAREKLQKAIEETQFHTPTCPIYQNVSTTAVSDVVTIKANLIAQLTAPVKWTQSVQQMVADGATEFVECGPGKVLQGLVKKIHLSLLLQIKAAYIIKGVNVTLISCTIKQSLSLFHISSYRAISIFKNRILLKYIRRFKVNEAKSIY
jgi:[acyl-carrier-protein] S-malonyltransferase